MKFNKIIEIRQHVVFYSTFSGRLNAERLTGFPNTYDPSSREKYWLNVWRQNNYFNREKDNNPSLRMILPPPNVTGVLHLGHALTVTIQDILARWHRMNGGSVLWIPGLDHAGIATQVAVEKYLSATKKVTRFDLGKDKFLEYVEEWKNEKGGTIKNQLRELAATLDWSKEYFTMSKEHNNSVTEAFVMLNNRDLLYRKNDLVNWSSALRSTISDIEVEHLEVNKKTEIDVPGYNKKITFGEIVDIIFNIKDSSDKITVSTTRVETMMGDVAIAVHPEDSRYSKFIGQFVWHPLREIFIPIIGDLSVKQDFGTGAVKVTPGHCHQDLEIAHNHNLEAINVIGEDGKLNENARDFKDLPRFIARSKMLDALQNRGNLGSIKDHSMLLPVCSRSGDIIEYLAKEQWFIRLKQMGERLSQTIRNGDLKLNSSSCEELLFEMLDNLRDWCVSRQLWWGHPIPAYFCEVDCTKHWIIARNEEEARKLSEKKFGVVDIEQDRDVLDTWFSSALLPLSALGWPNKQYQQFYPLTLMETGHDILFHWVARMGMLCTELSGVSPFNEVLLHGIVCDAQGGKMSKSRGNVILPEYVINGISLNDLNVKAKESFNSGVLSKVELNRTLSVNKKSFPRGIPDCGIDALRYTICSHNIKNEKISFCVDEAVTNRRFCNKIWQASKYILLVTDDKPIDDPQKLSIVDKWILSRLVLMVDTVNNAFKHRNFHTAIAAIKQFFYYEFCDFYIEATKPGLESDDEDIMRSHRYCLIKCLEVSLRTLAPVMPYLSEELYSRLSEKLPSFLSVPSIMQASFPTIEELNERDQKLEYLFDKVLKVVLTLRNILSYVKRNFIAEAHIVVDNEENYQFFIDNKCFFIATTRMQNINVFHACNYAPKKESIYICDDEYKLYYLLTDNDVMAQAKDKVLSKRTQLEKKLQDYAKDMSKPISANNSSEAYKRKIEEAMRDTEIELEKYPKFI